MNDILELIHSRRSCKSYTTEMPTSADIDKVVTAGLEAASGPRILFSFTHIRLSVLSVRSYSGLIVYYHFINTV